MIRRSCLHSSGLDYTYNEPGLRSVNVAYPDYWTSHDLTWKWELPPCCYQEE